ncbi:MAG: hypothetical protein ACI4WT_11860 [Oligosphaeraceae bacterium]
MQNFPYADILALPHHVSQNHPPMPLRDRAAQFSPFAALDGHGDAIRLTARHTEPRRALDEEGLTRLDTRLRLLATHIRECPEVIVEHFVPDAQKEGGAYVRTAGRLAAISPASRRLMLADGTSLSTDDITDIESPMLTTVDGL